MLERRMLRRRSRLALLLLSVALFGWVDYISGPEIGISLFYLLPVVIAGWLDGETVAVGLALAASSAWVTADLLTHARSPGVVAWNGFTRVVIYVSVGILMSRLRKERDGLRAANKELQSFTYTVSHDLRSPLLHIGSYAAKLDRRAAASLDDESARYLATIAESASTALTLIDELLDFSRLGRTALRRSKVDLGAVVEDVRHDLMRNTDRRITWRVAPLPTIAADAPMIRLVFHNLLENAVKYSARQTDPTIEIGSRREVEGIVVYVRDNGIGFDPQYSGKLFQVFERLHDSTEFEGSGIGLAIVERIVQRHGGRSWADGEVGRGATFYVSLPVS